MRLRHIPGSEETVAASPYVIGQPQQYQGNFQKLFGNDNPIEIEIGMGKGKFIMELAKNNPQTNYLGIERYPSVLLRAIFIFLRNKHSTHIPVMQYFQYIFLFSMFFHKIYCFDLYICYIFHYIARICTQRFEL